jgi:glycosyltransferase involved in cell wall biosynthesis
MSNSSSGKQITQKQLRVAILTSADDVADARLHRLSNALIKDGCQVEICALGEKKNAPVGSEFWRAPGNRNFSGRILRDLVIPLRAGGDVWVVVAPDLLPTTWLVAKLRGKKIVADVHEDYVQLLKDRSWAKGIIGIAAKMVARLATQLAASSDMTSVADTQVPPFNAKNRIVVRNLPDTSLLTISKVLAATPTAIYIGDVRKSRGLFAMLEAAERATSWNFEIIGNLSAQDSEAVKRWQATSPASTRVTFHGRLAPRDSWKFAEHAWVGLTLLESTPAFVEAVPSKLYEYMSAGLATISTPLPRCADLIEQSGGGAIADSASRVADILNRWAANPDEIRAIRLAAKTWADAHLDSEREYRAFVEGIRSLS